MVRRSTLVLVLIGARWLEILVERRAAGQAFSDSVHIELLAAIRYEVPLLGVLVQHASMPKSSSLPTELSPLATIPSVCLRATSWRKDVHALREAIERHRAAR
jgi:hypothetical protein